MDRQDVIDMLDYTLLKPAANRGEIAAFCEETVAYGFKTVFVNPYWIPFVREQLKGTGIRVGAPIGFSLGGMTTKVKVAETVDAIEKGAAEIDMLINLGALKSGEHDVVLNDIEAVVRAANGLVTKVIIETALLSDAEKEMATRLIIEAGADYVKTATGFNGGGATVADIRLLRRVTGERIKIKAAGGVRTWQDALDMIEAGASRIGTSNAVNILKGERSSGGY